MFKVIIKNQQNMVTNQGTFKTMQEANEWLDAGIAGEWWGVIGSFTHEIVDITAEVTKQAKKSRRTNWRNFGAEFLDEILEINSAKYEAGELTVQQLSAMYDDAGLLKLERALKLGDLKAAKALIAQLDNSVYSAQEKQDLINKLTDKIGV